MMESRDPATSFLRPGAGRACAALLAAAAAAMAAAHAARADAIPARSFVQDSSGDGRAPVAVTAGETDAPVRQDTGGVLAASAHPADAPPSRGETGEPFDFVPTLRITPHPLPAFDQPPPVGVAPQEQLPFTPAGGGPVALQLFLPAGAGEDTMGGVSLIQLALTDAKRGYLAQLAPDGLDTLREARCAAAKPRPAGCDEPSDANRAGGGLLSRLSVATIPLPSAVVLLLGALVCLGAVAWRRKRLGL